MKNINQGSGSTSISITELHPNLNIMNNNKSATDIEKINKTLPDRKRYMSSSFIK